MVPMSFIQNVKDYKIELKYNMRGAKEKMLKNKSGITLIALVVTIVVLLILAGVSISMLAGENGIIKRAQEAKEKSEIAEEKELVEISAVGATARNNGGEITYDNLDEELAMNLGDREYTLDGTGPFTVTYTDTERSYIVETNGEVAEAGKDETGISIKLTLTHENKTLNVSELPNVKEVVDDNVPIPQGFYYVGGTKSEGIVISDTPNDDLDNSKQGNQFVWVPVNQNQKLMLEVESKEDITEIVVTQPDGAKTTIEASGKTYNGEITMKKNGVYEVEVKTATTTKIASRRVSSLYAQDVKAFTITMTATFEVAAGEKYNTVSELLEAKGADSIETLLSTGGYPSIEIYMMSEMIYVEELKEEFEELMKSMMVEFEDHNQNLESVNKYGGYYIGRYEAGDGTTTSPRGSSTSDTNTLVSRKGAYVYNWISNNSAKSLSSGMYSGNGAVTSQLITGAGWDRALNWIIETGEKTEEEVLIDSRGWGNDRNSTGNAATNSGPENMNFTTGRSEYWKTNNIYDLAGNTWEWTQETYQSTISVYRGDGYNNEGDDSPAGVRVSSSPDYLNNDLSFRTQLYINV